MRHEWMDGLRGAAVLAVVLMHAGLTVEGATGVGVPLLDRTSEVLGPVRMPLLVLLSGLLLQRSLDKGPRRHLRGKVDTILWPYAVWATLDVTRALLDAWTSGRPVPWDLVPALLHDPQTYLWFLGYLFVFHALALGLPAPVRTVAAPLLVVVGEQVADPSGQKFLVLLGWFLVGDALARLVGPRVPLPVVRAAARTRWGPFADVGRQSVVWYASHLLVMVLAVDAALALGVGGRGPVLAVGLGVPLLTAAVLVRLRGRPWVEALFVRPPVGSIAGRRRSRGGRPSGTNPSDTKRDACLGTPSGRPRSTRRPPSTPSAARCSPS